MPIFRKGDIVTIEATIDSNVFLGGDGSMPSVKVRFPPYHDAYVDPALLTMKLPDLREGDRVSLTADGTHEEGKVMAAVADSVWVMLDSGDFRTWPRSQVARIDSEPATESIAAEPPLDGPYETPPSPADCDPNDPEF